MSKFVKLSLIGNGFVIVNIEQVIYCKDDIERGNTEILICKPEAPNTLRVLESAEEIIKLINDSKSN